MTTSGYPLSSPVSIQGTGGDPGLLLLTDGTNELRVQAPAGLAGPVTVKFPNTNGATGNVLATDGAGNFSWVSPSSFVTTTDITDTVTTTTTSTTYVTLTNMSTSLAAGTYVLNFSTSVSNNTALEFTFFRVINGATPVLASERSMMSRTQVTALNIAESQTMVVSTNTSLILPATATVAIQWRVSGGTGTSLQRTMTLLKIA